MYDDSLRTVSVRTHQDVSNFHSMTALIKSDVIHLLVVTKTNKKSGQMFSSWIVTARTEQ